MEKECIGKECSNCMWSWGAIKHHCNERGGDAVFEESGGAPTVKEFIPYELGDGPLHKLRKDQFDSDGKLRIRSKAHEKAIFKQLGVHAMARGEVVCGIRMEMKDRPSEGTIYSFPKSKG